MMAIRKPGGSGLTLVMSARGRIVPMFNGERLRGVSHVEIVQGPSGVAEAKIKFMGPALKFQTEASE